MIKKNYNYQKGMSYVELIVVLAIFGTMSSIAVFDYNKFQDQIDIRVLSNDIALKLVEAQKSSIIGKWNVNATFGNWVPSYGLYFSSDTNNNSNKNFIYFADLIQNGYYDAANCTGNSECIEQFAITKGNFIKDITINGSGSCSNQKLAFVNIVFKRPQPKANIYPLQNGCIEENVQNVQMNISSPDGVESFIKVFPSGRIQIR